MIHLMAHLFIYEENIGFPVFGALPLLTLNVLQLLSPESLGQSFTIPVALNNSVIRNYGSSMK